MNLSNLALVGLGIYLVGDGICKLANPGSYAMIGGGILVIVAALI